MEDTSVSSAADNGSSSADLSSDQGQDNQDTTTGSAGSGDRSRERTVSWKDHRRAVDDMLRYKREAQDAKDTLNKIEEQGLKDKEQWKTIAERKEAEANEWKQKYEEGNSLFRNTQKYSAVKKAAVEAGLLPEAMDDLDLLSLEEIEIETTDQGRFAVRGVSDFVRNLKARRPYWFRQEGPPNVNSGGGKKPTGDGKLTPADVVKAEAEMLQGKITREQYHEVFKRFQLQRSNR